MRKLSIGLGPLVVAFSITLTQVVSAATFSDLADTPYAESIYELADAGVLNGYGDGTFRPLQSVTRAEFLKIALMNTRPDQLKDIAELKGCFEDVKGHWAENIICFAKEEGFVKGDGNDGLFHPERTVNLVEASKMMYIIMYGRDFKAAETAQWYAPYIDYMEIARLIPPSVAKYDQLMNRGEVAEMVSRIGMRVENAEEGFNVFLNSDYDAVATTMKMLGSAYAVSESGVYNISSFEQVSADVDHFKPLDAECQSYQCYWRDSTTVYIYGDEVAGADVGTFRILLSEMGGDQYTGYAVDKNAVYYRGVTLTEADPATFEALTSSVGKDNSSVYIFNLLQSVVEDPESFQVLIEDCYVYDCIYGDSKAFYRFNTMEKGAKLEKIDLPADVDLASFSEVADSENMFFKLYKDDNNYYYFGLEFENIEGFDGKEVEFLRTLGDDYYSSTDGIALFADADNYYLLVDEDMFNAKGSLWLSTAEGGDGSNRDCSPINFCIVTIPNPDDAAFYEFYGSHYFGVGKDVYFTSMKIEGADVKTFTSGSENNYFDDLGAIAIDANNVYLKGKVVEGADADTFDRVSYSSNYYFKDSSSVYYRSSYLDSILVKLTDADVDSFHIDYNYQQLWGALAVDKDHVYYQGNVIEDADPRSFEFVGSNYACGKDDANYYLLKGVYTYKKTTLEEWAKVCGQFYQ